jgi:hypothetical protein
MKGGTSVPNCAGRDLAALRTDSDLSPHQCRRHPRPSGTNRLFGSSSCLARLSRLKPYLPGEIIERWRPAFPDQPRIRPTSALRHPSLIPQQNRELANPHDGLQLSMAERTMRSADH